MVGIMTNELPPWHRAVYRNTHGRGVRRPTFGTRLPRYRTRCGVFDDLVAAQIRRLSAGWPEMVRSVQFGVEDVPPSDPTPWDGTSGVYSRSFPAGRGVPPRIILYRMPIQHQTRNRMELELIIRDELVQQLAELYGRSPEQIDPMWGK